MLKNAIEVAGIVLSLIGVAMFSIPIALILAGVIIVIATERN